MRQALYPSSHLLHVWKLTRLVTQGSNPCVSESKACALKPSLPHPSVCPCVHEGRPCVYTWLGMITASLPFPIPPMVNPLAPLSPDSQLTRSVPTVAHSTHLPIFMVFHRQISKIRQGAKKNTQTPKIINRPTVPPQRLLQERRAV